MTQKSRFFDLAQYTETDYAEVIGRTFADGISRLGPNFLAVTASAGLNVNLASGVAMIQGFWYYNDAALGLSITANTSGLARIDRLVLRLDRTANSIIAVVKQGTPGSGVPPALTRVAFGTWELSLAQISVPNNAASVTVSVDERGDVNLCGFRGLPAGVSNLFPDPTTMATLAGLNTEISNRAAADTAEANARAAADNTEANARAAADTAEANARIAADNTEATTRAAIDSSLQTQITNVNGSLNQTHNLYGVKAWGYINEFGNLVYGSNIASSSGGTSGKITVEWNVDFLNSQYVVMAMLQAMNPVEYIAFGIDVEARYAGSVIVQTYKIWSSGSGLEATRGYVTRPFHVIALGPQV